MKTKYFGTDGLRGKAFSELTLEKAYYLGLGLKHAFNNDKVVIGIDTRESSVILAHIIASAALKTGVDVFYADVVSTPMIAHYSKVHNMTGIMITASHNPFMDNGIKLFNKGYKSSKEEEILLEKYIDKELKINQYTFGNFSLTEDVYNEYIKLIDNLELSTSNIKLAYDSANGANFDIAEKVISKYFPNSIQINNRPNGKNINLECGSTYPHKLKEFIIANNMDLGFAYDGDGDRVILLDSKGNIYDGDFIVYLVAKYLKKHNQLKNNGVVLTKMSNPGILKALEQNNINYVLTDVGDKNVYAAMKQYGYIVGGESSGHIIIDHILHSGDGLLVSLYILKLLEELKLSLEDIAKEVKLYPLKMVNISNISKDILEKDHVKEYLENYKEKLDKKGLFLVRPSGTEPLIRVTLSLEDENELNEHIEQIVSFIKNEGMKA